MCLFLMNLLYTLIPVVLQRLDWMSIWQVIVSWALILMPVRREEGEGDGRGGRIQRCKLDREFGGGC